MKLVLEEHRTILKSLIGQTIQYGLFPNLYISNSETYPGENFYHEDYNHFYSAPLLNLRFKKFKNEKSWITFSPGPDEDIKDWAPFWVKKSLSPDFFGRNKETDFMNKQLKTNTEISPELENNYLDTHIDGLGMTRCDFWDDKDPIKKIEVFNYSPYAACVIIHDSGMEWCMYAEYDFKFWTNFSQKMVNNLRVNSESTIVIE